MENLGSANLLILVGAALAVLGVFSSLVASRIGAPLLLIFLLVGLLAGQEGPGGIKFNDFYSTYLVGSAALAIVLFDGGLRTRFATFRGAFYPAISLATIGVVITAVLVGLLAAFLLKLSWVEGLLVGAIVASTDAAAVFFLLRAGGQQLKRRVASTLEMESGTNDPIAVFMTLLLVQLVLASGHMSVSAIAFSVFREALEGAIIGIAGGFAISYALNRIPLPSGLHPLLVVASALFIYGLTVTIGGSGFLAVYLAGIVLGNRPVRAFASITTFHDTLTWLCQIAMFIMLGLLVTPSKLVPSLAAAFAIAFFLIVIARPVAVWLCLAPFRFQTSEKVFMSWVGLRGAVSIFLAAIPTLSNVPHADTYFSVAFVVVVVSLIVQGWSLTTVAQKLGVALDDPAPSVKRIEIDLPGQLDEELVGYPIVEGSPVVGHGTWPAWAKPVLIIRNEAILSPQEAGALQVGDYGYFLAPPQRVERLDRLFAPNEGYIDEESSAAFPFKGDVRIGAIADMYELNVQPAEREMTVAELFDSRFEENPRPGNRIDFGHARLVVRELADDKVSEARLDFVQEPKGGFAPIRSTSIRRMLGYPKRLARKVARNSKN
ncbi:MAG: potassium/proton antiporter [Xanthobacteraceae bacterium]|nr:potassium/proton antiporter [Xanthobacteraceae bacterium]MBX3534746.1 potassium/proton antiporter [Xanthobacteraceae bacterium]MBX3550008.1 potassium/proton antiporter [Xanthobacteraceae bacterium]MCW5674260.1 potassium/proton antiporter [Xanthobacteraceae bacterium]